MKTFLHRIMIALIFVALTTSSIQLGNSECKEKDKMIDEFMKMRNRFAKGQVTIMKMRTKWAYIVFNKDNKDSSVVQKVKQTILETDSLFKDYSEIMDFAVEEFDYNYKKYSVKNIDK